MSIFEVGRLCVKLAGRDAGKKCVVVDSIDVNYVMVDGATRRKKVNIKHLEPLDQVLDIKSGASHSDVKTAFEKIGVKVVDTKSKEAKERPKRMKKAKVKPEPKAKEAKPKKEEKKVEEKAEKEVKKEELKPVEEKKEEASKEVENEEAVPEEKPVAEEEPSEEIKEVI